MADQFNDSIPAVTNQITEDVADIAESLGFLKDCFEATCTGWNNADASGLKVDVLADAVTRLTVLQGADVTAAIWRKIINIGDWDMDATSSIAVAHGLTLTKIRSVTGMIRSDDDALYVGINPSRDTLVSSSDVSVAYIDATNITLVRRAGSTPDGTDYNATSFNRGWLVIEYVS
jgi:hypothetical protein